MASPARVPAFPKRSLGQNFLTDDNIARNIVRDMRLSRGDAVLEIGPGTGALTRHLAAAVDSLVAVETDGRIVGELAREYSPAGVAVVHADFLEIQLREWKKKFRRRMHVAGNIPYHLTSRILFKVFEERASVSCCTLMVQKEVARRLVARPGSKDYGILSVMAQLYGAPSILFSVSPNCFTPRPQVVSAVVQIPLRSRLPRALNESLFRDVVRSAFGKRRKTLRNSLRFLPLGEEETQKAVGALGGSAGRRAEELSVEEFVDLTNRIEGLLRA